MVGYFTCIAHRLLQIFNITVIICLLKYIVFESCCCKQKRVFLYDFSKYFYIFLVKFSTYIYYCPTLPFTVSVAIGWYGVVCDFLMLVNSSSRLNILLSNFLPWVCKILWENSKWRKYLLKRNSAAALPALSFLKMLVHISKSYLLLPINICTVLYICPIVNIQYKLAQKVALILYWLNVLFCLVWLLIL